MKATVIYRFRENKLGLQTQIEGNKSIILENNESIEHLSAT